MTVGIDLHLLIWPLVGFSLGAVLDRLRDWKYGEDGRARVATTPDDDPRGES